METNFRRMNEDELASLAENVAALLAGASLTAIAATTRTQLIAAIGTLPDQLRDKALAEMVSRDEWHTSVTERNGVRDQIEEVMAQVRDLLKAASASADQFEVCGFRYPFRRRGRYVAADPTGLSISGTANGVNRLKFSGNNNPRLITYEIHRRPSRDGEWSIIGTTKKQTYDDLGVTPGQYYEYKVRAVAARSESNFSNRTVVYEGTGTSIADRGSRIEN